MGWFCQNLHPQKYSAIRYNATYVCVTQSSVPYRLYSELLRLSETHLIEGDGDYHCLLLWPDHHTPHLVVRRAVPGTPLCMVQWYIHSQSVKTGIIICTYVRELFRNKKKIVEKVIIVTQPGSNPRTFHMKEPGTLLTELRMMNITHKKYFQVSNKCELAEENIRIWEYDLISDYVRTYLCHVPFPSPGPGDTDLTGLPEKQKKTYMLLHKKSWKKQNKTQKTHKETMNVF